MSVKSIVGCYPRRKYSKLIKKRKPIVDTLVAYE